ncbi:hypothetical protein BJY04DRAFT_189257 [Aspergillus karnatakaensis]|uniref:uncharacterized protein n=1 Tax=Aspergillus karnatakaensis TaxID=1810916 RepID=UPI003CCD1EE9
MMNALILQHIITPGFWILGTLLCLFTSISLFNYLANNKTATAWLQPSLTTRFRKNLALAAYHLIMMLYLHQGRWILETAYHFLRFVNETKPAPIEDFNQEIYLPEWLDWLALAVVAWIGTLCVLICGWMVLGLQAKGIVELRAVDVAKVSRQEKVAEEDKKSA